MKLSLIVADDFSESADQIRDRALAGRFEEVAYQDHVYPGVQHDAGLEEWVRSLVCPKIARLMQASVVPKLSFFRMGLRQHKPEVYIHSDTSVGAQFAAVYYLTPANACIGGTAFWTHRETMASRQPTIEDTQGRGDVLSELFEVYNRDTNDESKWDMDGLVPMKWNRMILYPGDLFHSRFPKDYVAETNDLGRLIWVCFFDTK